MNRHSQALLGPLAGAAFASWSLACGGTQASSPAGGGESQAAQPSEAVSSREQADSPDRKCKPGHTRCSGTCVDKQTDGSNCGTCGHDCQGGACSAGVCQPLTLASNLHYGTAVAVDSVNVYFADEAHLQQIPVAGGTVTTLAGVANVATIAPVSHQVLFGDLGEALVETVPIGGGTVSTLATNQGPYGIATGAGTAYWTNYGAGEILTWPLGGGAVTTLASGQGEPFGIALRSGDLYWSNYSGGALVRLIATEKTLVSGQDHPWGIAVDATNLYWAEFTTTGAVLQTPLGGGAITTLASGLYYPQMAIDSKSVYFENTNMAGVSVMKVPIGGGTVKTLATNQAYPEAIAVDSTCVYWVTETNPGALLKVAKD